MVIYLIKNLVNQKTYVGKTAQPLEKRFYQHCSRYVKNMPISRAIKKYGANKFEISILETVNNKDDLNSKEIFWIQKINPDYNISKGGDGGKTKGFSGRKHSESTKSKMKDIHSKQYDGRFEKFVFEGEKNGMSKLTNQEAKELIKDIMETDLNNRELGEKYGLHKRYVSLIRNKRRWKHMWDSI
jgi:group I intron endonuclease